MELTWPDWNADHRFFQAWGPQLWPLSDTKRLNSLLMLVDRCLCYIFMVGCPFSGDLQCRLVKNQQRLNQSGCDKSNTVGIRCTTKVNPQLIKLSISFWLLSTGFFSLWVVKLANCSHTHIKRRFTNKSYLKTGNNFIIVSFSVEELYKNHDNPHW